MPSPPPLPKQRGQIPYLRLFTISLIALIAGYLLWRRHLNREIEGQLAFLKAGGCPITLTELDASQVTVPAEENAALVLTNAFAHLVLKGTNNPDLPVFGRGRLPARADALAGPATAAAEASLAENAEALRLMRLAWRLPQCRFPVDLTNGWGARLPHLPRITQLGRVVELEAITAKEPTEAIASLTDLLRLEAILKNEPLLISLLVRIRLRGFALEAMERLVSAQPLTDTQLNRLEGLVSPLWQPDELSRGMSGEICTTHEFYEVPGGQIVQYIDHLAGKADWSPGTEVSPHDRLVGIFMDALPLQSGNYLTALEGHVAFYRATQAALPARLTLGKMAVEPYRAESSLLLHWNRPLAHMVLPGLYKALVRDTSSLARLRAATLSLAIERYRNAHDGRLPESLQTLVPDYLPEISADPYTGQPMHFKRNPQGYVIYSVGADLEDNGGREFLAPMKDGYDDTFVVER